MTSTTGTTETHCGHCYWHLSAAAHTAYSMEHPHAALVLTPNMEEYLVAWPNDDESQHLGLLYRTIGCQAVELVTVEMPGLGDVCMWLSEEGKLDNLAPNPLATDVAHEARAIMPTDYIAGTVVLTSAWRGSTLGFTADQMHALRAVLGA